MFKQLFSITAGTVLTAFIVGGNSQVQAASLQVIARGLESPRGLTFGPDGALYVTEAGSGGAGPCIPAPGGDGSEVCYGATGGITRIENRVQTRIVSGLPSIAQPLPELSITFDATGIHDIQFDSSGRAYAVFGLGSSPDQRDGVLQVPEFGQFVAIDNLNSGTPTFTGLADLVAYEGQFNPDKGGSGFFNPYNNGIDSNPYTFLIKDDTAYIIDAAGNDFFKVKTDGSGLELLSVFPTRPIADPLVDRTIDMQSVPTSLTIGPDGAFYVGEFTGFPYPNDAARIFRLGADNKPEVFAEGFTQIIDMAFDDKGGLYVLEFADNSLFNGGGNGSLIYINPDGTRQTFLDDKLLFPTALELGSNGDVYISNRGFIPGQGEVLRFNASVPEPSSILGLAFLGGLGVRSWRKRSHGKSKEGTGA
jgi:hypothetical protein